MSVGGKVIDVYREKSGRTFVNTHDGYSACAIYVDDLGNDIKVGDMLWWQGGYARWTPKPVVKGKIEIKLPKLGYSFSPKAQI